MNSCQKYFSTCLLATAALLGGASTAWAQIAPSLGTAAAFGALGGTGVTCTTPNPALPATTVTGDVGSGTVVSSVTGFPPDTPPLCSLSGTVRLNLNGTAPINDLITAYNALRDNNTCPSAIASHNLDGSLGLNHGLQGAVLEPGVYCISGTGLLTSQLTLNGPANAVWIFKAASDLTPKGGSVVMAGGGNACNVYWQVGTAVDLLNTAFVGNVLAGTAITFTGEAPPTGTASSLVGRALAQSNVTMTGANITNNCGATPPGPVPGACSDRVTGKGSINITTTNKAKFRVTGGINKKGKLRGRLTYSDDGAGLKVTGTGVTAYVVTGDKTRHIEGTASIKVNGVTSTGTYTVDVTDGEPGGTNDTFAITLSTGYASGTRPLASGNIKIKRQCDKNGNDDDDDGDDDGDDEGDENEGAEGLNMRLLPSIF